MYRRNLPTKTVHLLQLWKRRPPSPTKQSHEKHPLRSRNIPDEDEFEGWSDVEEIYAPAVPDEDPEDRNVTLPRPTHGREETGRTQEDPKKKSTGSGVNLQGPRIRRNTRRRGDGRILRYRTEIRSPNREEKKLRKGKTYEYNAWNDMMTRISNMTFEQLSQLAPTVKSQVHAGLTGVKPGFEIVEVNHAKEMKPEEDRQEDSDEKEDTKKTSAYAVCQIENHDVGAIIDTGAGGCIVSKNLLDRLGWGIDKPTKMTIIVASEKSRTSQSSSEKRPSR